MNSPIKFLLSSCLIIVAFTAFSNPSVRAGFRLPDSINEVTIRYKRIENLILIPVTINDSIQLNLILDTGCRNMILFGKKFLRELIIQPGKGFQFSGLGSGRPVNGSLSLGNKVSIGEVLGERIPIVVVPQQGLFGRYHNVDGIIGYDVFIKFEIELDPGKQIIFFRPAATAELGIGFTMIPIKIIDSKPVTRSTISLPDHQAEELDLLIDTGSSLGLLLKLNSLQAYNDNTEQSVLGQGLNGDIMGHRIISKKVALHEFEFLQVRTGIIESPWPNEASIGMEVLKEYSFVLNYCKGYMGLRKGPLILAESDKEPQKPLERMNF